MKFSRYDNLSMKTLEGIAPQNSTNGLITIVLLLLTSLLFISELVLYARVDVKEHLTVHEYSPASSINVNSITNRVTKNDQFHYTDEMLISMRITFFHLSCKNIDIAFDDNLNNNNYIGQPTNQKGKKKKRKPAKNNNMVRKSKPTSKDFTDAGISTRQKSKENMTGGCTVSGFLKVAPVGGTFRVSLNPSSWGTMIAYTGIDANFKAANNVSHYIHAIDFSGFLSARFPYAHNPFDGMMNSVSEGVGLANFNVKIVPTAYKRPWRKVKNTYQISMTESFITLPTLIMSGSQQLPGASFSYDFSPMEVQYVEQRDSLLTFVGSLCSVLGGVFVSLTLVSSCVLGVVRGGKKLD